MSLRYKALAAVVFLVTAVTGGLLLFVKARVEELTRTGIERELSVDSLRLRQQLSTATERTQDGLRAMIGPENFPLFFATFPDGIKNNLEPKVDDWRRHTRADYAIAALDSRVAEERRAPKLHAADDYWIVATVPTAAPGALWERLAASAEVNGVIGTAFRDVRTVAEVIPVGDALFLAVATPFFEQPTDFAEFCQAEELRTTRADLPPPWGVAAVLIELSSAWAKRNQLRPPEDDGDEPPNPIHEVLFAGNRVAASSLDDRRAAEESLIAARAAGAPRFMASLPLAGPREASIGLVQNFREDRDRPASLDRPGFIAVKSLDRELVPLRRMIRGVMLGGLVFSLFGAAAAYGA